MIKFFAKLSVYLFRRGHGIFRLLFAIDDLFRIFAMTILIPIFFSWLKLPGWAIIAGALLGLVIDVHDFVTEFSKGKVVLEELRGEIAQKEKPRKALSESVRYHYRKKI